MSYVAVDKDESEWLFTNKPYRAAEKNELISWGCYYSGKAIRLIEGSIEKLIGKKLTWEDEPVKLEEQ